MYRTGSVGQMGLSQNCGPQNGLESSDICWLNAQPDRDPFLCSWERGNSPQGLPFEGCGGVPLVFHENHPKKRAGANDIVPRSIDLPTWG